MNYFFDICISPRLVKALREIDGQKHNKIDHLRDLYDDLAVPDEQWISDLGRSGNYIIISGDKNITRKQAERAAWKSSGLTAFFLTDGWSNMGIYEQASYFIKKWPHIVDHSKACKPGSGFLIRKSKTFDIVY